MLSLMKWWSFVLVVMAATIQLINAQADDNFISIDCGYADSGNGGYIDSETNLKFTSDDAYVDTGNNHQISTSYEIPSLPKQSLTVRSFPTGSRNCYRLPANKSGKYLLRAAFMYGDYDVGMPMPMPMPMENNQNNLMFDLYLGIDVWASVSIEDPSVNYIFEAITVAQTDIISVCLINMNHGTPFISSLEMRPLDSSFYPGVSPDQTLALSFRYNMGPTDNKTIRYPDDSYDRIWRPYNNYSTLAFMEKPAPGPVNYISSDLFHVPSSVLLTAVEPIAPSGTISLPWFPDKHVDNPMYYLMLHFCNLYKNTSVIRKIDVSVKGGEMSSNSIVVEYLVAESVYSTSMISDMESYYFNLSQSADSAYVPLLNAVEVYYTVSISNAFTDPNDDMAMNGIKKTYNITRSNWQGDPCAPNGYTWDDVRCITMNNTPRITYIDLSSGNLVGPISDNFSSLTKLMFLDLSNNSLEGPIPDFLGSLTSLNVLNLSGNCFSGSIPNNLLTNNGLTLRYEGYNACKNNIAPSKPSNWKDLAIIILACLFGATLAAGVLVFFIQRKTNKGQDATIQNRSNSHAQDVPLWPALTEKSPPEMTRCEDEIQLPEICKFTYRELEKITDNFIRFIGRGGFGPVYHGYLEDTKEVAVKIHAHLSTHGMKEFLAEVGFLAKVHHRNLVELVGYCREENHLGLVYEYMSQGCLNDHLRSIGQYSIQKALNRRERLQIALDAAQGLDYLHTGSDAPIIHRDVKSSNILLDKNFRAKIADFGLSKAFQNNGQTHMSTKPAGTLGYIDIEYYSTGRLTEKSDVYSFGIVLLELVTGELPMDPRKGHIKKWVLEMLVQGDIDNIADSTLKGDFEINSIWKVVDIAIYCTADSSEQRPTMNEVVIQLKESLALEITRETETQSNASWNASGPGPQMFGPTLR